NSGKCDCSSNNHQTSANPPWTDRTSPATAQTDSLRQTTHPQPPARRVRPDTTPAQSPTHACPPTASPSHSRCNSQTQSVCPAPSAPSANSPAPPAVQCAGDPRQGTQPTAACCETPHLQDSR